MVDQTRLVNCTTLYGAIRPVPIDQLIWRASAYGVVLHEDRLLVATGTYTHKYVLPGGGVELGETVEAALKREMREETGLEVVVGDLLFAHDDFFYYDPNGHAFQSFMFYYRCTPLTFDLRSGDEVEDDDIDAPQWVPVDGLDAGSFQTHGELTMRLIQAAAGSGV